MKVVPMARVLVLNGPNLGRLGRRQPEIYGSTTYDDLVGLCEEWGRDLGLDVEVRQTNHEGEMLDWLNAAADTGTPVVLNAAAWTHYSYALFDACAQLEAPLVEVHISDPASRPEEFRHTSLVTPYAAHVIAGPGHRRLPPRAGGAGRSGLSVSLGAPQPGQVVAQRLDARPVVLALPVDGGPLVVAHHPQRGCRLVGAHAGNRRTHRRQFRGALGFVTPAVGR